MANTGNRKMMAAPLPEEPKSFIFLSSKKREAYFREKEMASYGIVIDDIQSSSVPNRFLSCILRSILIFLGAFGTVGGIVNAFDLPYIHILVIPALMLLSVIISFIYYNNVTFYAGYIVMLLSFIIFSISAFWYINSGYQAFMNIVYEKYSDFFNLLSLREASEYIDNRLLTVSIAMIFVGWVYCIFLNISISGYMNLPFTFILTFFPMQVAFYIDQTPSLPYMIILISMYICVAVLGRSGHFRLPYRNNKKQDFYKHFDQKKNITGYSYVSSGRGLAALTAIAVAISTVFLLLTGSIFHNMIYSRYTSNAVKDKTDEYVKSIVQGGIYSMLNSYRATGGLSRGRLGGIGRVNPDFETDLIVHFVPYGTSSIYLKAFTGVTFDCQPRVDFFYPYTLTEINEDGTTAIGFTEAELTAADDYIPILPDGTTGVYRKMMISNSGADASYAYHPYFSLDYTPGARLYSLSLFLQSEDSDHPIDFPAVPGISDMVRLSTRKDPDAASAYEMFSSVEEMADLYIDEETLNQYEVLFVPYEESTVYVDNPGITEEYEEWVYDTYLQVPESLEETLHDFCEESGMLEKYENSYSIYQKMQEEDRTLTDTTIRRGSTLQAASTLKSYFQQNFNYTMAPGSTPYNVDFIEYFLETQRRGYCAHFAASATLLFRSMGIPARYIEGYVIQFSDLTEATAISDSREGWVIEDYGFTETGLLEVQVPDANAHAWVEIYLDGYGWVPYEMTPPSDDEETAGVNDLFSLFSGLFRSTTRNIGNSESTLDTAVNPQDNWISTLQNSLSFLTGPLNMILLFMVVSALLFQFTRIVSFRVRIAYLEKKGRYSEAAILRNTVLLRNMRKKKLLDIPGVTARDITVSLQKYYERKQTEDTRKKASASISDAIMDELKVYRSLINKAGYAPSFITKEEYATFCDIDRKILRSLKK